MNRHAIAMMFVRHLSIHPSVCDGHALW